MKEHDDAGAGTEATELTRRIRAGALPDRRNRVDRRAAERRRRHLWNLFFFFSVVIAVLIVLPPYLPDGERDDIEITPDELIGTWVAQDPRYADRFITIERDLLTIGLGEDGMETHPIASMRGAAAEVHREYQIGYRGRDGTDQTLEVFVYDDGILRLRNPSEIQWRRQ